MFLDGKAAPMPEHGGNCFVCGMVGQAVAVVCDKCLGPPRVALRFACRGYPATDGRVPYGSLGPHPGHDEAKHLAESAPMATVAQVPGKVAGLRGYPAAEA